MTSPNVRYLPTQTDSQTRVRIIKTINQNYNYIGSSGNDAAKLANLGANTYSSMVTVPSEANFANMLSSLHTARSQSTTAAQYNAINQVLLSAEADYQRLYRQGLIPLSSKFPMEPIGITYETLRSAFLTVFTPLSSDIPDTPEQLALDIFNVIDVLNPNLTLDQLTSDIRATMEIKNLQSSDIRSFLYNNVNNLPTLPTNTQLSSAIFGDGSGAFIISGGFEELVNDLERSERLMRLNKMISSLVTTCEASYVSTDQFSSAVYNTLYDLGLGIATIDFTSFKGDSEESAEIMGSLSALTASLVANLQSLNPSSVEASDIRDSIFRLHNGIVFQDKHDLLEDIENAKLFRNLENILIRLKEYFEYAKNNANESADDIASNMISIAQAYTSFIPATVQSELTKWIEASGDKDILLDSMINNLESINCSLSASAINEALFNHNNGIQPYDKLYLTEDLEVAQWIRNYGNIDSTLISALNDCDVNTAEALTSAIIDNIGPDYNLDYDILLKAVRATVASGSSIAEIKTAMENSLGALSDTGLNASNISNAIFDNLILANPYDMLQDLIQGESYRDYHKLIEDLLVLFENYANTGGQLEDFADSLRTILTNFGGTLNLSREQLINDLIGSIHQNNVSDISTLASNLYEALNGVEPTAEAISNALYGEEKIISGILYNLLQDAIRAEKQINFTEMRNAIMDACTVASNADVSTEEKFATAVNAFATSIINSCQNSLGELTVFELSKDIVASIRSKPSVTLSSLANAIYNKLDSCENSERSIDRDSIIEALYHEDRIIFANLYDAKQDLSNAEKYLQLTAIGQDIVNNLNILLNTAPSQLRITPPGAESISIAIVNGVGSPSPIVDSTDITYDISYTYTIDNTRTPRLFAGSYGPSYALASILKDSILNLGLITSPGMLSSTLFASNHIIQDPNVLRNDLQRLTSDISNAQAYNTVNFPLFNEIALRWGNAVASTINQGTTTTDTLAGISVNQIGALNPMLLASELVNDFNYNSPTSQTSSVWNSFAHGNYQTAQDIVDYLYDNNQVLSLSPTNQYEMASMIDYSVDNTHSFNVVASNIKLKLNTYSSNVGDAIADGVKQIFNGDISNPSTIAADVTNDVVYTENTNYSGSYVDLVAALTSSLDSYMNLAPSDITAENLVSHVYPPVISSQVNKWLMREDVSTAMNQGYSYPSMLLELNSVMSEASVIDSVRAQEVIDIIDRYFVQYGYTPTFLASELNADFSATIGNYIDQILANLQGISSPDASQIRDAFYDVLTISQVNREILTNDLSNYANIPDRISSYFGQISSDIANIGAEEDASDVVSYIEQVLNINDHTLLSSRLIADFSNTMNIRGSTISQIINLMKGSLEFAGPYSAENIAEALINQSVIMPLLDTENNMLSDLTEGYLSGSTVTGGITTFDKMANELISTINQLANDASNDAIASALLTSLIPCYLDINDSELQPSRLARDIEYTFTLSPYTSLSHEDAVSTLKTNLVSGLLSHVAGGIATASELRNIIYNCRNNGIVSATDDKDNFYTDLLNTLEAMNEYPTLQSQLASQVTLDSSSVLSFEVAMSYLSNYAIDSNMFANDLSNGIVQSGMAGRISGATVSDHDTAAVLITSAVYQLATLPDYTSLVSDLYNANIVDDYITDRSAIGGDHAACSDGQPRSVYSCNAGGSVTGIVATNDCTLTGRAYAETQCYKWAYQPGVDLYGSYSSNGNCSEYLGDYALKFCLAGLDELENLS